MFDFITRIFGNTTFRRKLLISIILVFSAILFLSYNLNSKVFYTKLDELTNSVIVRNSNIITDIVEMRIGQAKALTAEYANNMVLFNLISENKLLNSTTGKSFLSTFGIVYYNIQHNGQTVQFGFELSENTNLEESQRFVNLVLQDRKLYDSGMIYENVYVEQISTVPTAFYYVCSIAMAEHPEYRVITIAKITGNDIYRAIREAFNVYNIEVSFYEMRQTPVPDAVDSNDMIIETTGKPEIDEIFAKYKAMGRIDERSKVIHTRTSGDTHIRYMIFDEFEHDILMKMKMSAESLSNITGLTNKAIQTFDSIMFIALILTCIFIYYVINYLLNKFKLVTKVLMFINANGRAQPEDIEALDNEAKTIDSRDDYGILIKEFNDFVQKNKEMFIDNRRSIL